MDKKMIAGYASVIVAISFVIAILVPLPSFIIDLLLVLILGVSVLIYMRATTIDEWSELKTFPTILLILGIFRISVNISTTRAILSDGNPGTVIQEMGRLVVGGNLLVGLVVFLILIIFQFIVTNGSSRTAEVAARFSLESMPGKQMAIDSDLQQKLITDEEAKKRRKDLNMETDFYGSMDGAGKFIKGDVIAGIAITIVNVVFGLITGVAVQGMSFADAGYTYTLLTVGDGIVNQVSSLLVAVASGIVITRVYDGSGETITEGIFGELMKNDIVVYAVGGLFAAMGIFTSLPILPFVIFGGFLIYVGWRHQQKLAKVKEEVVAKELAEMEQEEAAQKEDAGDNISVHTKTFPILVEVGMDLIPLIKQKKDGQTARDKVNLMRRTIAKELGIRIPAISFQDNSSLKPKGSYVLKINGTKVGEGDLKRGHLFALKTPLVMAELEAEPGNEPIFNQEGYWIEEDMIEEAKLNDYQILEPLGMLVTHLDMTIRKNLHELIQRQQIKDLVDTLENEHQVLLEEIKKKEIDLSLIQRVVQQLLREGISIQRLPTIVEGVIDGKDVSANVDDVTSVVRSRLANFICEQARSGDGKMHAILLSEEIEMNAQIEGDNFNGYFMNMEPELEGKLIEKLSEFVRRARLSDVEPVLLIRRRDLRFAMARMLQKYGLDIHVISVEELVPNITIEQVGIVG